MKLSTIYKRAADTLIGDGSEPDVTRRTWDASTYRFTCNAICRAQGLHWQDFCGDGVTQYSHNPARVQYSNLLSPSGNRTLSLFDIEPAGDNTDRDETYALRYMMLLTAWQEALAHGE